MMFEVTPTIKFLIMFITCFFAIFPWSWYLIYKLKKKRFTFIKINIFNQAIYENSKHFHTTIPWTEGTLKG